MNSFTFKKKQKTKLHITGNKVFKINGKKK